MNRSLIIIGAGGLGAEFLWTVETINQTFEDTSQHWQVIGTLDDDPKKLGTDVYGYPVIGSTREFQSTSPLYFAVAVGNNKIRAKLVELALSRGLKPATLIDPSVKIAKNVEIGAGVFIAPNALIAPCAQIKDFVIINTFVGVGHEVTIEHYAQLC